MGSESSKPVVEEGATVFDSAARDLTPPPGTGRYADDGNVKIEPGTSSPLASSLNVGVLDRLGAIPFHHGLPSSPSPERKHVISASNPEFHHELPHLSSPNRVRPPSPPPATEPAPFAMPDIADGLPRVPSSPPSEKKPTISRKKQRASATISQNPIHEPASPLPASSAASVDAATPQGLTRAQRKELKRQRRLARKSGAALADFSSSLNGAGAGDTVTEESLPARKPGATSADFPLSPNGAGSGDTFPEESLPAAVQQPEDGFDAARSTASSPKKKKRHGKRTINGLQMSMPEDRSAESADQHQEAVNGVDLPHGGTGEEAAAAPHRNAARKTPIDGGDESGALRKWEQELETSPRAERKPKNKKAEVAHEGGVNGSPPRSGTPHAQATNEDIPDAPTAKGPIAPETETPQLSEALGVVDGHLETTSPDRRSPPAFSTPQEPPSTVKRRKRKNKLRGSNPQGAEGDRISTPEPARAEHIAEEDATEPSVDPIAPEDVSANPVAAVTTPPALGNPDPDPQPPAQSSLPHAPASDPEPREELLDEIVSSSLGSFRPINGSTATRKRHSAAVKGTPAADRAFGDAIVPTPKTQASRKRRREPVDRESQVEVAAAGTAAPAEGSPNQNVPTSERRGGDDATDGTGSREGLEPTPHPENLAPETSRSRRASAKKRVTKPSYFESEARANKQALEELPTAEATTPAKRPQRTARTAAPNRTSAGPPEKGKQKKNRSEGDYASGPFTAQENAAIKRAVEEFRAEQGMTQQAINTMIHENPVGSGGTDLHRELWEKVAPVCPRRRRQKIILRARALFHNFVGRGVFTPEQDQELRELVEKMGQKWAEIGRIVDRNPLDLRDRWRNYAVCGDKKKTESWEEAEVSRLTDLVIDAINTILRSRGQEFSSEKSRERAERDVAWDVISKHMDRTRSAKQCREKWALLQARRAQNSDGSDNEGDAVTRALEKTRADLRKMTPSDKLALIRAIHTTEVTTDEKIPWAKLGDAAFQKRWKRDTLRIMWSRLRPTVPGHEHLNTRNVAQALLDSYDKDQVLPQLEDVDVDDKMEAFILEVVSATKKKPRAPRKLNASGTTPSQPKKRKRQGAEEDDRGQEDSGGEGPSTGSAKRTKNPKRRRTKEGLRAARRLSAQVSSAHGIRRKRPGSSAGIQLSSQFVESSDDSGDEEQRARSPEVPASPEPPERLAQRDKAADEPPHLDNDEITDSQAPVDDDGEDDVRAETESVDLGAQPGPVEKRNKIRNGVGTAEDILSEAEAQGREEASITAASSRKRRASPTFSPAFAHDRFKKQRSSMQTYSSKKTLRTPFSARRRTFADVYDEIEEAHGESSQPRPASAKKSTDERQGAPAQRESIAGQAGKGSKLVALEGDSDSDREDVPATLPKFPSRNPEDAVDSEAERRRLAEESDEDSDMEDIPARLPGTAEDSE